WRPQVVFEYLIGTKRIGMLPGIKQRAVIIGPYHVTRYRGNFILQYFPVREVFKPGIIDSPAYGIFGKRQQLLMRRKYDGTYVHVLMPFGKFINVQQNFFLSLKASRFSAEDRVFSSFYELCVVIIPLF